MHSYLAIHPNVVVPLVIPVLLGGYHALHSRSLVKQFEVSRLRGLPYVGKEWDVFLPRVDD